MAPAGLHRARWMAKGIYAIKVYMFRGEFKMTKKEEVAITELWMFVVSIYVYHWFQAPSCRFAPRNDLKLLKDLKAYNKVNEAIAEVALKKFSGHLWYLSEVLAAFAFFDENVPLETKTKMVQALENEGQEDTLRRITIDSRVIEMSSLEDFVSQNTRKFFSITGLSPDFLEREVVTWESDPEYLHIKNIVSSMRVVNDIAERGVALMEEYNKLHTQNEEQKQYLLLTIVTDPPLLPTLDVEISLGHELGAERIPHGSRRRPGPESRRAQDERFVQPFANSQDGIPGPDNRPFGHHMVLIIELLFAPPAVGFVLLLDAALEEKSAKKLIEEKFCDMLFANYAYWPIASFALFRWVPAYLRPPATSLLGLGWTAFMSWCIHNERKTSIPRK
ncbi:unnamed protein product [Nesidiocoris tenuis]|uniref:Uncharacterized protein n=2 Tax=Nesidiocoris tenuis TaxID=355587 RepID=A0A6H5GL32_9HEMI|nr:unnamed protein product [Nesidiocoris tenuis]